MSKREKQPLFCTLSHFIRSVVPLSDRPSCLLAILVHKEITAYFDESQTQSVGTLQIPRHARVILVAGFIGWAEQWEHLECDWKGIFRQHHLPEQTVFHMSEFSQSVGAFKIFMDKQEERERFLSQLIGSLGIRVITSIVRAVKNIDYNELDSRLSLTENASPYTLCGMAAISCAMTETVRRGGNLRIVFDRGFPNVGQLTELCKRKNYPIPSFEPKENWKALQAADLIAWESQKGWKKILRQEMRNTRKSMLALARIKENWADYTPENLLHTARHIGCIDRV